MADNDKAKPHVVPGLPGYVPARADQRPLYATRVSAPNVKHDARNVEAFADGMLARLKQAGDKDAPEPTVAVTEMKSGEVTITRYDLAATLAALRHQYDSRDPQKRLFAMWNYVAIATELLTQIPDVPQSFIQDIHDIGIGTAHLLEDMANRRPNPLIVFARRSGTGKGRKPPGQIEEVQRYIGLAIEYRKTITERFEPLRKPTNEAASEAVIAELRKLTTEHAIDLERLFGSQWKKGTPEDERRPTKKRRGPVWRGLEWQRDTLKSLSRYEAAELATVQNETEADARAALKMRMAKIISELSRAGADIPALKTRRGKKSGKRRR